MAARSGPPPKPTALRLIEGGGRLGRYAARIKREPRPTPGLRAPPKSFSAEQLAIWNRLLADTPYGLLTRVDHDLVVNYCTALAIRDHTLEKLNATGGQVLVKALDGHSHYIVNPYVKEFRRICDTIRCMQQELGFTPASRTRVAVQSDDDEKDPLARFLGDKKAPGKPPTAGA